MTPKAENYGEFHRARMGSHLYPTEFVIRTMLGSYPRLHMSRDYEGKRLLDLGFGDGRNLPLFRNLGVAIYGAEPDPAVCAMVARRVAPEGITCDLRVGNNAELPFETGFFDYVVACHSIYYVRDGDTFDENLKEVSRVLRPGGWLVATLPIFDNFILTGAQRVSEGHYRITADPYGLRNGSVFRAFASDDDVTQTFSPAFGELSIGTFHDDWYGILVSGFAVVASKASS